MAYNVNISTIYLGNYSDVDTFEGNIWVENAGDLLGTYGSDTDPLWKDRVTIDTDSPTIYVDTNQDTGNGNLTYDAGAGTVTTKLDSLVEFNATITYTDGTTENIVIDVIQTTNGDVFVMAYDNYTQLDDKPIESIELTGVYDNSWAGFEQASYDTVTFICFTPGTLIATPTGPCPVENLARGDQVTTADNGAAPIVWTSRRRLRFPPAPDRQKPVEIKAGCLGARLPRRSLILSPQHRVVLSAPGEVEAFAPAHTLEGLPGVRRMTGRRRVDYIALLLARHQVIFAEGAPVESFYPGREGCKALSPFARLELRVLLPQLRHGARHGYGPFARPVLTNAQARQRARKLARAWARDRQAAIARDQKLHAKVGFAPP